METNTAKPNKFVTYYKSLSRAGKTAFWIVSVVALMLIVALLMIVIGYLGAVANLNYINKLETIGSEYSPTFDDDNYSYFTLKEGDEDFKVTQLTDLHIGGGVFSISKDRKAIDSIYSLIKYSKPDMITVTGDMVYPFCFCSGTKDNGISTKMVIKLFEKMGVPYAVVFGNHDYEYGAYNSKAKLAEMWASGKNSLFRQQSGGGADVYGEGNYVIKVLRSDGTIHSAYIMMDSNSYVKLNKLIPGSTYDCIHEDQVEWYKTEAEKLNGAKSFLFFHIPLEEYKKAWDAVQENNTDAKYYYGYMGDGGVWNGYKNTGLFDAILEKGSTIGVFCGHDHLNNFSIDYKGVRLTYGMSIDFLAYAGITNSNYQRGCTNIVSYGDSNFTISTVTLAGLVGYKTYKL